MVKKNFTKCMNFLCTMVGNDFINGHIERKAGGVYEGMLKIDGIDISPIEAQYFEKGGEYFFWLKRKKLLEYDDRTMTYIERNPNPKWEVYMKKGLEGDTKMYKGEFVFMHFCYSIVGLWDKVFGKEKFRLNLFTERLPQSRQKIINAVNERLRNE